VTNTAIGTVKSPMRTAMKHLAATLADDDVRQVDATLSVGA
jgi:ribosomal protein S20